MFQQCDREGCSEWTSQCTSFLVEHRPECSNNMSGCMVEAAANGHLNVVKYFLDASDHSITLEQSVQLKQIEHIKQAVQHAASNGHLDVVNLFFDHGLDVDIKWVAAAAKNGHLDIVKYCNNQWPNQAIVEAARMTDLSQENC
ncbi:hypothetical protein AC1031_020091 [Aphanomyces cochlioides]|nr:hypothetical protein AC1031_020091 [Aphanomyces cochlioides]